jgi:hypothetical protein
MHHRLASHQAHLYQRTRSSHVWITNQPPKYSGKVQHLRPSIGPSDVSNSACALGALHCYGRPLRESSEMRSSNLEWGYPPRRNSFIRRVRTVLIATAVGASFGGIVVLLFFAPSIERRTLTEERQLSQSASTPTLRLNRTPTDLESAKASGVGGQLAGAAATGSTPSSTLAMPSRPITAEQRTVTDHRPGEPVAIAAETAAQAITPVETNATKRPHIAISETRSGYRRYALGKYYMRVGDARPHHAHRNGLRAYQNADWRYGSWD